MLATPISGTAGSAKTLKLGWLVRPRQPSPCGPRARAWHSLRRFLWPNCLAVFAPCVLFVLSLASAHAQPAPASSKFHDAAKVAYETNKVRFQAIGNDKEIAWNFARTCFDWAEFARSNEERERIASEGINACQRSIEIDPKNGPAHYYLGLNRGQFAKTRSLASLKVVEQMEAALRQAVELDPKFDYAGPHRAIGILYAEAPGWPLSVGNKGKARTHLEKAAALAPGYPGNHLALLEARLNWSDRSGVAETKKILAELLPKARAALTGEQWESSWAEWDQKWKDAQQSIKRKWPGME